ncbi:MAG: CsiV family protein [Pseudomonadota bacterium]
MAKNQLALRLFFVPFTTLLLALPAAAPAEDRSWYDVEIIVFTHEGDPGSETWPLEPERPATRNALPILPRPEAEETGRGEEEGEAEAPTVSPALDHVPFQALPTDEFQLPRTSRRIFESEHYHLLAHTAWRQPGLDRELALPIHLQGGLYWREEDADGEPVVRIEPNLPRAEWTEELTHLAPHLEDEDEEAPEPPDMLPYAAEGPPPPVIDGTIRIIQTRYLHADIDLLFRTPDPDERMRAYHRPDLVIQDPNRADAVPDRFRIVDSRRMRSGEIHYIDHPLVGIIVYVTPYEFADSDSEEKELLEGDPADNVVDETPMAPESGIIDR